jgi:D-alanyl-D-alanine carboxypeptidase
VTIDRAVLDQALARSGQRNGPGLYALVTEHGETAYEGAVGVADLDRPRPIEGRDRFRIGSVTKTYVAALVLQLVADGTLSLADPVERWLPGMVPGGEALTVELLLRMRSGLPDYTRGVFGDPPDLRALGRYWAPEQLVAMASTADDRLPPDTAFRYCNTDYVLLGLMVERATGQRVEAQLWQRILAPLRLDDTTFPTVDPFLRGPHAKGYLRDTAGSPYVEFTTMSPSESWTAGAIVATARDVAAFLDGLLTGAVLDPDHLGRMTDCREVVDEHRRRGLGIVRYEFGTGPVAYGHTGGMPGFCTVAMRTTAGRCVVLWQNGFDAHDQLSSDTPFVRAALSA